VGFVIGFLLGVVLGLLLQPAVAMLIAKRAHDAASKAVEADDAFGRVVVPPTSPPPDDVRSEDAGSADGTLLLALPSDRRP
jgi:hypothetical protein